LANQYGGGGHPMACGASVGTWNDVEKMLKDADELVRQYKETQKSE